MGMFGYNPMVNFRMCVKEVPAKNGKFQPGKLQHNFYHFSPHGSMCHFTLQHSIFIGIGTYLLAKNFKIKGTDM